MRDRACRTAHRAIVRLSATMDRTKTNAFAVVGGIALGSDSLARSFHGTRRGRRPGDEANTRPETSRLWVRLCRLRPATPHTAACRHQRSDCIDLSRRITYMPICALSVSTTVRVQLYMIVCNGRDRVRYSCTLQLYPDPVITERIFRHTHIPRRNWEAWGVFLIVTRELHGSVSR